MATLGALDRKLLRDLREMRGQAVAIIFILVAGVAAYVSMASVMDTLQHTLDRYYEEYAFGDGFATVRRAPEEVAERLGTTPGIVQVQTRVVAMVNLEIAGYDDQVAGLMVSVPGDRQPELNRLFLRTGSLPAAGRENEVLLNEVFAEAHGLCAGDTLAAVINGRRRTLQVTGVALSPEHLMQVQPGVLFPDPERFGVLWINRSALAAALDMRGAFNDVSFRLAPKADVRTVIDQVDLLLAPYGGQGAYARADQGSHRMITEEFNQLRGMAAVLPSIFLAIAAFLLNIVIARVVSLQREQIGVLKAFGYRDRAIGWHYVKLVLSITCVGTVIGMALGVWAGRALGTVYLEFFRFPYLEYALNPPVVVTAVLLTSGAALIGVMRAVRQAILLPPAEAMRPAPPSLYRQTLVERLGLRRFLAQPSRMILRNIERRPFRALFAVTGVACACAILVMGLFFVDSIDHVVHFQYGIAQREDLMVSFFEPAPTAALYELANLPGVQYAEPFRSVPVRLRRGHRSYQTGIEGIPANAYLRRVIDTELEPVPIPAEGIVLTERLATMLDARLGDEVVVEVLEGRRRTTRVPVSGLTQQYLGLAVYMEIEALGRLVNDGQALSGVYLLVDERYEDTLMQALRRRPRIAGILSQERAIRAYFDHAANFLLVYTLVLSLFAGIIAFGVVYNNVRVSLSERERELASLRVLGFTRGEIAYILLGESVLLTLLSIPLGIVIGSLGSDAYMKALETDMYTIPVVLTRGTYATAASVVLVATLISALIVRSRLNRLDLIAVLKTRE